MMRFKKNYAKSNQIITGLQKLFDKDDIEALAQADGFVKKVSPMTGTKFSNLCILGITQKGQMSTLSELCTMGMSLGVSICEQSLNERYKPLYYSTI